jgi:hypothetical protein
MPSRPCHRKPGQGMTRPPKRQTVVATVNHLMKRHPPIIELMVHTVSAGRGDQLDMLSCLADNAWRPVAGWTLTPIYVEHRIEAITMITAVHSWAVACVGATNKNKPDARDTLHRTKGLAASSLADGLKPCGSVLENSFHVWSSAVAILDKFLCMEGDNLKRTVFTKDDRHKLLLCACACYVVAWKNMFCTFELVLDQVYQCLLQYYTSTGDKALAAEQFKTVIVYQDNEYIALYPLRPTYLEKTTQSLSLEAAELYVLQVCGWGIGVSTLPDAIDAMLGTKLDTDARMGVLRLTAYKTAMHFTLDAKTMYQSEPFVMMGAFTSVCEAARITGVSINHALRLPD